MTVTLTLTLTMSVTAILPLTLILTLALTLTLTLALTLTLPPGWTERPCPLPSVLVRHPLRAPQRDPRRPATASRVRGVP